MRPYRDLEVLHMKVKVMQVGPIGTNCYILEDETTNKAAVIDPGDEADKIAQVLQKDGAEVEYILLTHGHFDHTGGVADLEKACPNTPVYIHKGDVEGVNPAMFPPLPKDQVRYYDEGDQVMVGSISVDVLHTPGHSKGSVVLKAGDILFTGDTLFRGSCGRTDLRGGSYEQIMASLKRLGELEGDFHVCPGHDRTSTLEQERRYNPFLMEAMRE